MDLADAYSKIRVCDSALQGNRVKAPVFSRVAAAAAAAAAHGGVRDT